MVSAAVVLRLAEKISVGIVGVNLRLVSDLLKDKLSARVVHILAHGISRGIRDLGYVADVVVGIVQYVVGRLVELIVKPRYQGRCLICLCTALVGVVHIPAVGRVCAYSSEELAIDTVEAVIPVADCSVITVVVLRDNAAMIILLLLTP